MWKNYMMTMVSYLHGYVTICPLYSEMRTG